MILGPTALLPLVKEKKLVEGLAERELATPEGAGFDLRLGEVYTIAGTAFLGVTHRETPKIEKVVEYQEGELRSIKIQPGDFYLVTTMETVNLPLGLCATFIPRTTTFRSGLFLRTGVAQPGYCGKLTFGLKNEGPIPVEIELGARFVFVQFHEVTGGTQYKGQWQGGRITTSQREKQI
jgi:deoxycytidine triphosphate deaminase